MKTIIWGLLLAFAPVMASAQTKVEYYHIDAIGSVRAVTDSAGTVVRRHDYAPFGEDLATVVAADPVRFVGKERDVETGLDYSLARFYAARWARFTTVDPVLGWQQALGNPQRWNRYTYSYNNPLRFIDPDGLDPLPAGLLQFFNAVFKSNFGNVDIQTGRLARLVTKAADGADAVTLGPKIFLSADAAQEYEARTRDAIALIGHELMHVQQYRLMPEVHLNFFSLYFGNYLANRTSGQSANQAYQNITFEKQGFDAQRRIREFLERYGDIFRRLAEGEKLTPEEIKLVERELGIGVIGSGGAQK